MTDKYIYLTPEFARDNLKALQAIGLEVFEFKKTRWSTARNILKIRDGLFFDKSYNTWKHCRILRTDLPKELLAKVEGKVNVLDAETEYIELKPLDLPYHDDGLMDEPKAEAPDNCINKSCEYYNELYDCNCQANADKMEKCLSNDKPKAEVKAVEKRYEPVSDLPEWSVFDYKTGRDLFPTRSGNRDNSSTSCRHETAILIANALNAYNPIKEDPPELTAYYLADNKARYVKWNNNGETFTSAINTLDFANDKITVDDGCLINMEDITAWSTNGEAWVEVKK